MQDLSLRLERRAKSALELLSSKTLIYLFFFSSGMPALAYQLIWQRVLFRIFGVNMESVTIVVTAFMLGLGIGSLIGSWLANRRRFSPLLLIAVIEISIGVFGLFSLKFFDLADHFVQDLSLPAKSAAAIGLVFIPTALMGMTLPLLVGHLISRSANVGLSTGSLYRANILGAVIGCVACALILFPHLGLQGTIRVAAGINVAVAAAALIAYLLLGRTESAVAVARHPSAAQSPACLLSRPAALGLAFFGGFVSLSYEIFLVRLASFASGTSALTLAIVLAAFLLGISSGAQLVVEWCAGDDAAASAPQRAVRFLLLNCLVGLLILPVLSVSGPLGNGMLGIIGLAAFLVARSLGVIFPLVAHLAVPPDERSASRIGILYLANILGSAAGSLLTGFVLTDLLGTRDLAILLAVLSFAVVLLFAWTGTRGVSALKMPLAATLAAVSLLVAFQAPLSARVMESMLYKSAAAANPALVRVVENRDGIIAVSRDGTVFGGGVYDGRFNTSLVHDTNGIVRAYSIGLYQPHPHDVLMIGLASGSWAQVIANNPAVAHFTIVEINPGYIQLIRERPEVASLLTNPKVRIVIDDGRRWLKLHREQTFDVIVANTTYHFRSNASNVLSLEFDDLVRRHLNRGGVYLFNTTDSARVLHTGCESFRYGYRLFNNLLTSDTPISMNPQRWKQSLLNYRIDGRHVLDPKRPSDAAALARILLVMSGNGANSLHADKLPIESCGSVLARTAAIVPVTDDNMGTEWRYPLGLN